MICYASPTGTRRNLETLRRHGWGLLVGPARHVWRNDPVEGFSRLAGDNGAWSCYQAGRAFDEAGYERFLEWLAPQADRLDWLVLPDIVAGGGASLVLSLRYLNRGLSIAPLVLIAVQDGMEPDDLEPLVGPGVGIFLGGSTAWKIARMLEWGAFCAEHRVHYHVARVNTLKRTYLAIAAGAHSIDGSSASRYAVTTSMLSYAARHRDLFSPAAPGSEWRAFHAGISDHVGSA